MPGIITSSSIKSGGILRNSVIASSPRPTVFTSYPAFSKYSCSNFAIFGSSSTTRIYGFSFIKYTSARGFAP